MKKLLHSCPIWLRRTENWIYTQARALGEPFEQHIICDSTTSSYPAFGTVHDRSKLPLSRRAFDALLRRVGRMHEDRFFTQVVQENDIELIHSHFGPTAAFGAPVAVANGIPHVVTFYGFDVHKAPRESAEVMRGYQDLFASVTRVLCEGPFMAQSIVDLGCESDKVSVQHLGIELEKFEFRQRTWAPPDPLRVLMAGRFCQKKGFSIGLQALAQLQKEIDIPLEITIVGDVTGNEDKVERDKMMAAVASGSFPIAPNFRGFLTHDELIDETYRCHLMLAPSKHADNADCEGGAPVGLIEAAATGMQIVASTHCDIPNVVIDGETGLLANEDDVPSLVSKLKEFVQTPEAWESRAIAGRKRVEEQFCAQRQGQRLAEIYSTLGARY